jgi:hypothetical protein
MADDIAEDFLEAHGDGYFELFRQRAPDPQFAKRVVGTFNFGELVFDVQNLDNRLRHARDFQCNGLRSSNCGKKTGTGGNACATVLANC